MTESHEPKDVLPRPVRLLLGATGRGVSDIANEPSWGGPSELQFHQHQQEYLTHWQSWAGGRTQ